MPQEIPELNAKQKRFVDDNWDKINFTLLVRGTFLNDSLDGRCVEARSIKQYLGKDKKPISSIPEKVPTVVLTEDQKELIRNNGRQSTTELTRLLFDNKYINALSAQGRAVHAYRKLLPKEVTGLDEDEICEDYKPSDTFSKIVAKANEYLAIEWDESKLNEPQKNVLTQVMNFMKSPRYLQMINSYSSRIKRKIFEGEFIRTVWDKPDLTTDDVNLCINLCFNFVHMITINKHKDMLDERYELSLADPQSKTSVALAEMIKAKTSELKNCDERQQKLLSDLSNTRSNRNKNKPTNDISVAKLIEWWKQEEERKKAIKFAQIRMDSVEGEAKRLDSMEDIYCRIMGISSNELTRG